MWTSEFLISFEAWTKLAQQWLVCAPLGSVCAIEPINKELLVIMYQYHWPKERTVLCEMRSSFWANGVPCELIKSTDVHAIIINQMGLYMYMYMYLHVNTSTSMLNVHMYLYMYMYYISYNIMYM